MANCHQQCYYNHDHHDQYKDYQGNAGKPTAVFYIINRNGLCFVDATAAAAATATAAFATTAGIQLLADHAEHSTAADCPAASTRFLSTYAEQSAADAEHGGFLPVTADCTTAATSSLAGSASRANARSSDTSTV